VELRDRAAAALATGGWVSSLLPPVGGRKWTGAGFLGTVEGMALWWLLPADPAAYAAVLAVLTLAACLVCGAAERALKTHDDPRIVLDEVVGFWWAAAFLPRTWPVALACFAAFRVFDSLKPPPARQLERLPGGWGVVADDVGAALLANLLVRLLLSLSPAV
jgi:phosphatidylglycerophosphatase A